MQFAPNFQLILTAEFSPHARSVRSTFVNVCYWNRNKPQRQIVYRVFFFTVRLCICYASSVAWCFVSINFVGNPVRCSRCNMHPRMWQLPSLLNYHLCHRGRPRKIQKYEMQKCKIQSTKIQENKNSKYGSFVSFFSTLLPPGQTSYKTLLITTSATTCIHLYRHLNVCLPGCWL